MSLYNVRGGEDSDGQRRPDMLVGGSEFGGETAQHLQATMRADTQHGVDEEVVPLRIITQDLEDGERKVTVESDLERAERLGIASPSQSEQPDASPFDIGSAALGGEAEVSPPVQLPEPE